MKIIENFINGNEKIRIISNGGKPSPINEDWRPVLSGCEMLVIIPDMHMYIYNHNNLDNFKYGAKSLKYKIPLPTETAITGKWGLLMVSNTVSMATGLSSTSNSCTICVPL